MTASTPERRLAEFVAGVELGVLSDEQQDWLKVSLLDSFVAAIASARSPIAATVHQRLARWQGAPEASTWLADLRLPAPSAALNNATLLHARDLDAVHDDAIVHPFTASLPAAFAVVEERGGTGAELLTAVLAGAEVHVRLGLASTVYKGLILTAVLGTFSAGAAAARGLGLGVDATHHSLGLCYSQAAGNRQAFVESVDATKFQPGFSARNGVTAASFAADGLTGPQEFLIGQCGYFEVYFEGDTPDLDALTRDLGSRFALWQVSRKPYPTCRGAHAPVDALLELSRTHGFGADDVTEVVVRVPDTSLMRLIGRPWSNERASAVDAQYSIPYSIASALASGGFTVRDLDDDVIASPRIADLSRLVTVEATIATASSKALTPVEVTVVLRDGARVSAHREHSLGHPALPIGPAAVVEKLHANVAAVSGDDVQAARLVDAVMTLDSHGDLDELGRLLRSVAQIAHP